MPPRHDSTGRISSTTAPARRLEAVDVSVANWTPSEAFGPEARALLIGVAGNVKVDAADYGVAVILPLQAGEHAISVTKIYTGSDTNATGIVALA